MAGKWTRGSEWRMWDLHIHSPGTKLNDNFKAPKGADVWDLYCARLEESSVHAFGITDYFSADGYFNAAAEFKRRYPKSTKVLFPNIELRTSDVVNRAREEVNVHLIFNPHQRDFEEAVKSFLQRLETNKTEGPGRVVTASELGGKHGFEEATTTRDNIRKALQSVYGAEASLTDYVLIVTAANNDGIRAERGVKRKAVLTDEFDKRSNAFFGNAGNVEHFLKVDRYEDKSESCIPKPTLSGCCAHSLADMDRLLGKTTMDGDRVVFEPTWIKADLTYDGLKQIIFEPASRVHIGGTAPLEHDEARVIRSVTLENAEGWFEERDIQLNPGLVSIIGQKGSGKSALAELIAYAADSWDTKEPGSFIRRAGEHIRGLKVTLNWADGTVTSHCIGDPQSDPRKVRYLSQRFVEHLCAEDQIADELINEIEAVIFAHTDPTDTYNASSFTELRARKTEGIQAIREQLREEIARLIREESQLDAGKEKLTAKKTEVATLKEQETKLAKQIPPPTTEAEKKALEQLAGLRKSLSGVQAEVATLKQTLLKIEDVRSRVTAFKGQVRRFKTDIDQLLKDAGIPEVDHAAFIPSFAKDTDEPLNRRTRDLQKKMAAKEGNENNPAEGTIRYLQKQIATLDSIVTSDKARQQRIKSLQYEINAIGIKLKRLEQEIKQIEGPDADRRQKCREERLTAYGDYFDTLRSEQEALEELYAPVKKKLGAGAAGDLEFSIRRDVDIDQWLERGGLLLDQRRNNPFGSFEDLSNKAREILLPAWTSGDARAIKSAHESFLAQFRAKKLPTADYVRKDVTVQDVREWLYEVDHVKLNYGLKYNNTELEKLSPGTKGIVLLILYLGLDTADTRPLIVDQPDENLDNESIYDMLRKYFEIAKHRRQIILISHNPNLVVNADSEQIIVATCEKRHDGLPRIRYESGSLENTGNNGYGIREEVCRILEGGQVAFQRRENRYEIPRKPTKLQRGGQ